VLPSETNDLREYIAACGQATASVRAGPRGPRGAWRSLRGRLEPTLGEEVSRERSDGKEQPLDAYRGQALLLVNVASECGLTPQYEALQSLQQEYGGRGLAVLGWSRAPRRT
jgi:Glutathione peroxidase